MKPFYQQLSTEPQQPIIFLDEEIPHFTVPWHFHPEIEILLVIKSVGTCYIGDDISRFTEGDISIIGENIPHWWKSDDIYLQKKNMINTKAHVIQFRKDIFDSNFINIPEMGQIKNLLERSQRGIQFTGKTRQELNKRTRKIFRSSGLERITEFILLLDQMSNSNEFRYHSSPGYSKMVNTYDFYRFNKIHEYIIHNFDKQIKLEDVASTVSMSPTAFCRYFKKHTKKTFVEFLTEFKIGHACKLIAEEKMSVSRACFESGFNNLSHFNVQFKKIVKLTPSEYKAAYSGEEVNKN
ncbi:AraC family transcriptional regulator [Roseimarinus sediminis]|uniref:AraC family transcriptional regulator n=1 Tax=Roseimarinus sediminis TaxID=1610899 RepID=UPI003D1D5387